MEKQYDPSLVEQRIYDYWTEKNYFSADAHSQKEKYSIVIPPPNVTGVLHMGHALNNTIQDVLTRYKRMDGYEALWIPGTDHAGIATQNVVERKLATEGRSRHMLGREQFLKEVWSWKEQYHATISKQLRKLGSSCDWERERFTMDEGLSRAVRKVFVDLYNEGLVYRGKYIVNWCPRCHTALADDEVDHHDKAGKLWHFKYPMADGSGSLVVATTRPETMLGDTAVAVNPKDERYLHLIGKTVSLPLVGREIPVIADGYVSRQFGTGAVKITPAHDPNDYQMGQRHNLEPIVVMDETAHMCGPIPQEFVGLDRFEARKKIVEALDALGLLMEIKEHDHAVGHCYRCDTIVEPYYSDQWFVKMKPLAEQALQAALNDEITFYPSRWKKTYVDWMENIRDWCISRQIWWGHRIPVWYCDSCGNTIVAEQDPAACSCGCADLRQDEDVMDTWFSSWLWPFSTMGWPEETDLIKKFFPTDALVTAPEILFFWVARMVMSSLHFTGKLPFKHIVLHGTVRDKTGRKMSKSLGNSIDPLEIIEKSGTDALRFSIIMITSQGADVFLGEDTFDIGRNFANKLWNASRFLLSNIEEPCTFTALPDDVYLKSEDRWILSRLTATTESVRESYDSFRFNEACHTLYDFIWKDYCDWYVEAKKGAFYNPVDANERLRAINVASYVLIESIKLLHPIMPFVTEELWHHIREKVTHCNTSHESIMMDVFPRVAPELRTEEVEEQFALLQEIVASFRNIRAENNVPLEKKARAVILTKDESTAQFLQSVQGILCAFLKLNEISIGTAVEKPAFAGQGVVKGHEIFLALEGLIDRAVEIERLGKEVAHLERIADGFSKRLNSPGFAEKAPAAVVEAEKAKHAGVLESLEKLRNSIIALQG